MSEAQPQRIVVFGATGHLGQEIVSRLEDLEWSGFEVVGVVSEASKNLEFEFRGELLDALTTPPVLRRGDLVFVCTPDSIAHEVVRSALQAQAPCIDCTGVMGEQGEVLMPVLDADFDSGSVSDSSSDSSSDASSDAAGAAGATGTAGVASKGMDAPLLALAGATTLAWAPLLEAFSAAPGVARVVGTVLRSASALGHRGLVALSEESIALFNQSEVAENGPAGQEVAFDVIPEDAAESRMAAELDRLFASKIRFDVTSVQVPTFVCEGASLAIELSGPLDEAELRKRIDEQRGLRIVDEVLGTRGLVAVEAGRADRRAPTGPTLRDAAGAEETLVGGLRSDATLAPGLGWRVWLSYDPVRIAAAHAIRLAQLRFPPS